MAAAKALDYDWHFCPRGVTVADAQAVLASLEARSALCEPVQASDMARRLTGFYPAREVNDAATYAAGVTALFAAYAGDFVKRVCDPVKGLPSRLKWLPTLAEIREALDGEKAKRDRIEANARWVLQEAERRAKEAQEESKAVDPAKVDALVAKLKASMDISDPTTPHRSAA